MVAPPSKCSKELAHAVYDDFKRKAIDEAKKRAAAQAVDYDTFKNLVSVAHLRPLQAPNNVQQGACAPSWSFTPDGQRARGGQLAAQQASNALLSTTLPSQAPSTSGEFARNWRRSCPTADDKYRYLQLCGPDGLRTAFRVEISSELLKDVLQVLWTCWLGHAGCAEELVEGGALQEAVWVAQVMEALSCAGRFQLAVQMLGATGKQLASKLVAQLAEALHASQAHVCTQASSVGQCADDGAMLAVPATTCDHPQPQQGAEQPHGCNACVHPLCAAGQNACTAAAAEAMACEGGGDHTLQPAGRHSISTGAAHHHQQTDMLMTLLQSIESPYGVRP